MWLLPGRFADLKDKPCEIEKIPPGGYGMISGRP